MIDEEEREKLHIIEKEIGGKAVKHYYSIVNRKDPLYLTSRRICFKEMDCFQKQIVLKKYQIIGFIF